MLIRRLVPGPRKPLGAWEQTICSGESVKKLIVKNYKASINCELTYLKINMYARNFTCSLNMKQFSHEC